VALETHWTFPVARRLSGERVSENYLFLSKEFPASCVD